MSPLEHAENLARPYGPKLPLPALVEQLNQIYHRFEAASYDQNHSEIFEQLPSLWMQMVERCQSQLESLGRPLRILDYGCGTGFAASQMISLLRQDRIEKVTCYDPSPEMLKKCEDRFQNSFSVELLNTFPEGCQFDVLLTNSLLHHLPDLTGFVQAVPKFIVPGGLWFAGHEPNRNYYLNPECTSFSASLRRQKKLKQLKSPSTVAHYVLSRLGLAEGGLNKRVAEVAFQEGLFSIKPSSLTIERLVDFAVPHSPEEVSVGRGLAFSSFPTLSSEKLELLWFKSYNYFGSYYQSKPSKVLKQAADKISSTYPNDGANVCAIFKVDNPR